MPETAPEMTVLGLAIAPKGPCICAAAATTRTETAANFIAVLKDQVEEVSKCSFNVCRKNERTISKCSEAMQPNFKWTGARELCLQILMASRGIELKAKGCTTHGNRRPIQVS
jgi:hypothetical protein